MNRSEDRKQIDAYFKQATMCTTIQAKFRAHKEKDTLRLAKEQYCKKRVAVWLGAMYRAGKARCMFREMKLQRKKRLINALRIQCAFRVRMSKKKAKRLRDKRWAIVTPHASTIIQRHWRGVLGRRKAAQLMAQMLVHLQDCLKATVRIQALFRMILSKRKRLLLQCIHFTFVLTQFRSSIKIQCCWRRYLAKRLLSYLKLDFEQQEQLRIASLSRISALVRCRLFRKAIQKKISLTKHRQNAARIVQTWYRNETERIRQQIFAAIKLAELKTASAILIQKNTRKRRAHSLLLQLRSQKEQLEALRESKATILCSWGRMCAAKLRVQERRSEYEDEVRRSLILTVWASTTIAKAWRGKLGRDRARIERTERQHRWKALFDEKEQRPFYYNQDTGQTKWEKPQVLLDNEPRPVCANCYEYQAEVECAGCQEYYCTGCFDFIHMGGLRAFHSFRTVYDFYGKRKDYDREPWMTKEDVGEDHSTESKLT